LTNGSRPLHLGSGEARRSQALSYLKG